MEGLILRRSWTTFAISDGKESWAIRMKCIPGQNPWKSLRANHQRRPLSGRPFARWPWRREQCWERTGSHGCADCRVFRFRIRLPWCTLPLRVPGTHQGRKRATPSWSRCTGRSVSRLQSLGTSIVHLFGRFLTTKVTEMVVVNTGSVSLSYDGDRRAAYLLLDEYKPTIRRVEYDLEKELAALSTCGLPHSDWIAKILCSGSPQTP